MRAKHKRHSARQVMRGQSAPVLKNPRKWNAWLYPFAVGAIFAGVVVIALGQKSRPGRIVASRLGSSADNVGAELPTLGQLTEMSDDELGRQDLALVNIRCAERLPGAEGLEVAKCMRTLDDLASRVRIETERHLYRVSDPRFTEAYHKSEAYFARR